MAASDHLGEQFITSTAMQNLKSGDFPQFKVGQLHRNQVHGGYYEYDWDRLHQNIDKEGMKTPLSVGVGTRSTGTGPMLLNGHHRAVAAMERGALLVPTHPDLPFSAQNEDNSYRVSKSNTQSKKDHPWVADVKKSLPPKQKVKPEIPGQMSML
jgi:hypothetical protein